MPDAGFGSFPRSTAGRRMKSTHLIRHAADADFVSAFIGASRRVVGVAAASVARVSEKGPRSASGR